MAQQNELASALTVRSGMVAGAVLGGLLGHWVGAARVEGAPLWPAVVGGLGGFALSWAALTWLARRHTRAGILAGAALTLAAAVALVARFVWPPG